MTYAVAVRLQRGVVFAADTRTNAGIDNVAQFRKLHFWRRTGDRVLVPLTAENLAVSQSVISIINEQLSPEAPADRPTLMNVNSMYRAARLSSSVKFGAPIGQITYRASSTSERPRAPAPDTSPRANHPASWRGHWLLEA
jgi:predicted proteasome-type protease